jgi:aminoglycoside phosphotransferase (APT) family kinase protein
MTTTSEHEGIARYLPADRFGAILGATPISVGLSGAGVHAITTETGDYVLRIMPPNEADGWHRQLAMLRLAADHGIAPPLTYVDEAGQATVSVRIAGPPIGAALTDPASRDRAIASLIGQLVALHAITAADIERLDPPAVAHELWRAQSTRAGFPAWALPFGEELLRCAAIVERDPRWALSHNDLNPGNLLWDGARIWIVDWSAAGMAHPYYDLATFSMFLQLADESALALLSAQERAPISREQAETFRALRRVSAILCGLMFMKLTPDDALRAPEHVEDVITLPQCYGMMRNGTVDLQTPHGRCTFGLALLRAAMG